MAVYMYLRQTRYTAELSVQKDFAKEHHIGRSMMLGPGQYAHDECKDPVRLIGDPLETGDVLIVYNVILLGRSHAHLLESFTAFHNNRIKLAIPDIKYFDDVPSSGNPHVEGGDYSKMSRFLRVFTSACEKDNRARVKQSEAGKKPVGRPAKTWETVSQTVRTAVLEHIEHPYVYTEQKALRDIALKDHENISVNIFRRLVREQKERNKHR